VLFPLHRFVSPRRFVGVNFLAYYSWVLGVLDGLVDYLGTSNKVIEIFSRFVVP
jgi:hypothetical protein